MGLYKGMTKYTLDPAARALLDIVKKERDALKDVELKKGRADVLEALRGAGASDADIASKYGIRGDWGYIKPSSLNIVTPDASTETGYLFRGDKFDTDPITGEETRLEIVPTLATAGEFQNLMRLTQAGKIDPRYLKGYSTVFLEKINSLQRRQKARPVLSLFDRMQEGGGPLPVNAASAYVRTFLPTEAAGIPTEWVGRVMKSLPEGMDPSLIAQPVYEQYMRKLSSHLMNLTDTQREAYLTALMRWNPKDLDSLLELVLGNVR